MARLCRYRIDHVNTLLQAGNRSRDRAAREGYGDVTRHAGMQLSCHKFCVPGHAH
jgi:hypothetical protein